MRRVMSVQGLYLGALLLSASTAACSDSGSTIGKTEPEQGSGGSLGGGGPGGTQTGNTGGGSHDTGGARTATGGSGVSTGGARVTGGAGGAQSGTGGLAGGAGGTPATGGAPQKSFPCNNPTSQSGGFVRCNATWMHRATKEVCAPRPPRPNPTCTLGMGGNCATDSDCTARPEGYCPGGVNVPCDCVYPCQRDEDCRSGEICECSSGACVAATCTTDADCNGGLCSQYSRTDICSVGFACQTPLDECADWADCGNQEPCTFSDGHRKCGGFCPASPP